jgi:hypothetical protein
MSEKPVLSPTVLDSGPECHRKVDQRSPSQASLGSDVAARGSNLIRCHYGGPDQAGYEPA